MGLAGRPLCPGGGWTDPVLWGQSTRVLEAVIAVLGAVVGASTLALGIAGHRHNVRQAERLTERERRIEQRERDADQREALVQPSMLHMAMTSNPSVLADRYVQWRLEATNTSNQPFHHVTLRYGEVPLECRDVLLQAGKTVTARLPAVYAANASPSPFLRSVEFTDVAGKQWCRLATGQIQSRSVGPDGESRWHTPVAPIVSPHVPMTPDWSGPFAGAARPSLRRGGSGPMMLGFRSRRRAVVGALLVLVIVVITGYLIIR